MSRQGSDDRQRAADLMRDGREREYLALCDRHSEEWARDDYLQLQRGVALWRLDRLAEAEAVLREVRAMAGVREDVRDAAMRYLATIDEEWGRIARGRDALTRARGMALGGVGFLLGGCVLAWLIARRRCVGKGSEASPEVEGGRGRRG